MLQYRTKVCLCVMILLTTTMVIGSLNVISRSEYYFSHPSKKENLRKLPAISSAYLRYYHWSWTVPAIVLVWSVILLRRKNPDSDGIVLLAAYAMFATLTFAMVAALALYFCNQTFVFRFQHLE